MNWFTPASMVDFDVSGIAAPPFFMGFSISMPFITAYFVDISASLEGAFGLFLFSFISAKLNTK